MQCRGPHGRAASACKVLPRLPSSSRQRRSSRTHRTAPRTHTHDALTHAEESTGGDIPKGPSHKGHGPQGAKAARPKACAGRMVLAVLRAWTSMNGLRCVGVRADRVRREQARGCSCRLHAERCHHAAYAPDLVLCEPEVVIIRRLHRNQVDGRVKRLQCSARTRSAGVTATASDAYGSETSRGDRRGA
jgi:hypothetical protein